MMLLAFPYRTGAAPMAYRIVNTKEERGYMHDASRPYVLIEIYYRGYKGGMSRMVHGRYTTERGAKIAAARKMLGEHQA
jgi:hypothetical protein